MTHVSFSLDAPTRESHDRWRGAGSFDRVIQAFARCWASPIPFHVRVVLRRDTVAALERVAMLAARLGADLLSVGHLLPTSLAEAGQALIVQERADAEREVAALAQVLRMRLGLDVGYWNTARVAPCAPLAGVSANVDWRGRATLCCNLSGYRGGSGDLDVVADLSHEGFGVALQRLRQLAAEQVTRRSRELEALEHQGRQPTLERASPCLFCLAAFHKAPWMPMTSLEEHDPGEPPSTTQRVSVSSMSTDPKHTPSADGRPNAHVVFTDLGDAGVLVDLDTRQYFQLNDTASFVWRRLLEGQALDEIVAALSAAYDVSPEGARDGVEAIASEFASRRLISMAGPGEPA